MFCGPLDFGGTQCFLSLWLQAPPFTFPFFSWLLLVWLLYHYACPKFSALPFFLPLLQCFSAWTRALLMVLLPLKNLQWLLSASSQVWLLFLTIHSCPWSSLTIVVAHAKHGKSGIQAPSPFLLTLVSLGQFISPSPSLGSS